MRFSDIEPKVNDTSHVGRLVFPLALINEIIISTK